MRILIVAAALTAILNSAQAQEATRAHLTSRPTAEELTDAFPVVPLVTGVSGRVALTCRVSATGAGSCDATEETPSGLGFGQAAISLVAQHAFAPATLGGVPMESTVALQIEFQAPAGRTIVANQVPVNPGGGRAAFNADLYPEGARAASIEGRALVACVVRSNGRRDCAVEAEEPTGWGFGDVALRLVTSNENTEGSEAISRVPVIFFLGRDPPWRWDRAPDGHDFANAYPSGARGNARIVLHCLIRADRTLDCRVAEENPPEQGFGAAALEVAREFRLSEAAIGRPGLAVGDTITVPIRFTVR